MLKIDIDDGLCNASTAYQWDKNQRLEIHGLQLDYTPSIHFSNDNLDYVIARECEMDENGVITVDIPNALLETPYTITIYICKAEADAFTTQYVFSLEVKARPQPTDYVIDDEEEVLMYKKLELKLDTLTAEVESACDEIIALQEAYIGGDTE